MTKYIDARKWVVLLKPLNGTPPGIYKRYVTIDGELAFVHPKGDGNRADIISSQCVFDDERGAAEYFAGFGVKRWVVDPGSCHPPRPCEIFQAFVRYGTGERHGRRYPHKAILRCDGGPPIDNPLSNCFEVYDTKKEALAFFRARRKEQKETVLKNLHEAKTMLAALVKAARESR